MSARGLIPMASSQTGGPASRGRAVWARPPGPRHLRSWCNFPAAPPVCRPRVWGSGRSAPRAPSDPAHSLAARAGAGAAAKSRDPTARAAIRVARGLLRKRQVRVSRAALRAAVGKSPEVRRGPGRRRLRAPRLRIHLWFTLGPPVR